jgi:hypothetical protein
MSLFVSSSLSVYIYDTSSSILLYMNDDAVNDEKWYHYDSEVKVKPSGDRILSCTTLFATSPPRSRATAPTIAYREVMSTLSIPDPCRLSAYGMSVKVQLRRYSICQPTLFGFQRVTLSSPYRSAICDSLVLFSTKPSASAVNPGRPFNAGCK